MFDSSQDGRTKELDVRRLILLTLGLLAAPGLVSAGTFERSRIAPDLGLDVLTRQVARDQIGRDLFANPYATVTVGNVDVYDVFPYVESRTFQIVSDPAWNRLVFGESGRSLRAYDGKGHPLGALLEPRGMAVDEANRVYVADAGHHRIVVLKAVTEFGDMDLVPLYEITGLARPYGVAYSDGGTPFVPGDDRLYVADTGKNRIVAFSIDDASARAVAAFGELGSGPGRFAGPTAIAVGRNEAGSTPDLYVADAHTRRIVHLRDEGGSLRWIGQVQNDVEIVTSLDTDAWGNLYAAAPREGTVRKFNAALEPVAELHDALSRPRSFHVPFVNVRDHRAGTVARVGRPNGVTIDQWADATGVRLWSLGVEMTGLAMVGDDASAAEFALTDRADVSLEVVDASTGRSLAHRSMGALDAGLHAVTLEPADLAGVGGAGDPVLRLVATSRYPDGPTATAEVHLAGGTGAVYPSRPILLGNVPNPVENTTTISFVLPSGRSNQVRLQVYDASGRLVRAFDRRFAPGRNDVVWDGRDARGSLAPAGIYFTRLSLDQDTQTRTMVVVH